MPRLKLIVAYDGAGFGGWQSQRHGNTIQDHLERAFEAVGGGAVRVHGAGRTDAGVHALGQCAHADVVHPRMSASRWPAALNSQLPPAIRVLRCSSVSAAFHARYSARAKVYRYVIWNGAVLPPFDYRRAWHIIEPLDYRVMSDAAGDFAGEHDFAAFAANRGKPNASTIRTLTKVRMRRTGPRITLEFEGSGFLYKMVRMMVGLLVQIGRGAANRGEIRGRLDYPADRLKRARFVSPPEGLVLVRVRY